MGSGIGPVGTSVVVATSLTSTIPSGTDFHTVAGTVSLLDASVSVALVHIHYKNKNSDTKNGSTTTVSASSPIAAGSRAVSSAFLIITGSPLAPTIPSSGTKPTAKFATIIKEVT